MVGANLAGGVGSTISGNVVTNTTSAYQLSDMRQPEISRNRVDSASTGFLLQDIDGGLSGDHTLFSNNFCLALHTCADVVSTDSLEIVNNSLVTYSGSAVAAPIETNPILTSDEIRLHNNLLMRTNGAHKLVIDGTSAIVASDYNNFFNGSGFEINAGGSVYASLAAYQSGTGFDGNSVSKSVAFVDVADGDLHLTGGSEGDLDLVAMPKTRVPDDYDQDIRSNILPYMGADEPSNQFPFGLELDLTVLLEGPHNGGGIMTTALNSSGALEDSAKQHPYEASPWFNPSTDSVAAGFFAANPTVVDWVHVELWGGGTIPSIAFETSGVGLLLDDGSVVDPSDPAKPLILTPSSGGSFYVAVYHRNHLAAISASPVLFNPPSVFTGLYDFTDSMSKAYGTSPMRDLGGGFFGLFAGDSDADGQIIANDFNTWLADTKIGATGYLPSDFNMDGQVNAADFNVWLANTKAGAASQIP